MVVENRYALHGRGSREERSRALFLFAYAELRDVLIPYQSQQPSGMGRSRIQRERHPTGPFSAKLLAGARVAQALCPLRSRELKLVCQGISPGVTPRARIRLGRNTTQPVAGTRGGGAGRCRHRGYKRSTFWRQGEAGTPAIFALHHSACAHPLHVCTGIAFELWRPQGLTRYRFYTSQQVFLPNGHTSKRTATLRRAIHICPTLQYFRYGDLAVLPA
ncbi:hypothetical protein BV20DRAFT_977640 [Pilatotrama ljubarskyi]|nr:hypothetical protein BV20DRAFT_977640 [Pilatotrama ljubarskyi]